MAKLVWHALAGVGALIATPAAAQVVSLEVGQVAGETVDGISAWKGIPFAQPPVGELRWRAPQPVEPWQGVRETTEYANDCMQIPFAADAAPLGTPPAEDCLYLNVWRPEGTTAQDRLPVMFWIYGGGFVNGGSSPAVYDGSELARQGVILVSFNYRLGRFGFFAHPALTQANEDNGLLGNYGYMDQVEALRWVQRNIAAFGGDPHNVTIFGESAGGGSVSMMMTSPMTRGLFDKAIVMSGGGRSALRSSTPVHAQEGPDGEDAGLGFAEWAGVEGEGADALASLRALPAETLATGIGLGQQPVAPSSGPMMDGMIVTGASDAIYAAGNAAPVPFMAGANTADIGFGPPVEGDVIAAHFGDLADQARAAYEGVGKGDPDLLRTMVYADQMMIEPARFMVQAMTKAGQPAWHYRAGYVPEVMREEWSTGLPHATEIPFFFRTIEARYPGETTAQDHAASAAMSAAFVNFARTGDPNGPGAPDWPVYDDQSRPVMLFGMEGNRGGEDPWRARLDVTQALAEAEPE
ncbi:carboxylesterase/lipase family protein [Aurantiacibacter poecillastricola]|uniref:carboxylesterase/lipase family protein n=1 Tax=Aurantiacibacter poecillastricola TaxID=3064385 RepID=UPI00273DB1B2|nr:carboxylesterase family protein [Aurantiacibacter sp. 219JJ12-13]MDP5261370.1 carboxylesterase family protein [Aurantiacibacter sp. 219JJ12-13]